MQINVLQWFRKIHLYLGVFTAPAILFFAFTGVLQTLGMNDAARDGSYKPPHWISVLAQIHKKQTAQLPPRRPAAAPAIADGDDIKPKKAKAAMLPVSEPVQQSSNPFARTPLPLKVFFVIVSLSLFASTFSGLYLSWKHRRYRALVAALVVAGIVVPLVLLKF